MTERFIKSKNGNVFYSISRHGNPFARCVIFLHGLASDHTFFDKQTAYFSKKNTVIAWDAPAHGKSRPYSDLTYKNAAEELRSVMDAEGIDTAVLIGHSMGGCIAQSFAERYPERVSGFVGIDTYPLDASLYSARDRRLLKRHFCISRLQSEKKLKESIARSLTFTEDAYCSIAAGLDKFTIRELRDIFKQGFSAFLCELRDISLTPPVLLLVGEHDKTGKILKYNREWAKKCDYVLHILPNAAHNSCADNPDACNVLIEDFLAMLTSESDKSI